MVRETGLDGTLRFAVNGNDYVRAPREGGSSPCKSKKQPHIKQKTYPIG